jgi:hypothetical protein
MMIKNHKYFWFCYELCSSVVTSAGATMTSPRLEMPPPPPEAPQSARENRDRAPRQRLQDAFYAVRGKRHKGQEKHGKNHETEAFSGFSQVILP